MAASDTVDKELAKARRCVERGQDRRALEILEPLLAAHPRREGEIQVLLTLTHSAAGRTKGALKAGRRAISLAPDSAQAHDALGSALRAARKRGEAVKEFDRAVALEPAWAAAHVHRSLALSDLKRIGDARAAAEEAIRLAPNDPDAHFALGHALNDSHPKDAKHAYEAALAHAPKHQASIHALSALRLNAADAGLGRGYGVADGLATDPARKAGVVALDQRVVDQLSGLQVIALGSVVVLGLATVVAPGLDGVQRGLGLGFLGLVGVALGLVVAWFVRTRLLPIAAQAPREGASYWRSFARRERLAVTWLGFIALALLALLLGVVNTVAGGLAAESVGAALMWGSLFMATILLVVALVLGLVRRLHGSPRSNRHL